MCFERGFANAFQMRPEKKSLLITFSFERLGISVTREKQNYVL